MTKTIILLTALLALAGCNTFAGLGQDMESAGQGLSNAATKTKEQFK